MADDLDGSKVAFVMANEGVEQVELTEPWGAVARAGGQPVLLAPEPGKVQAFNHLTKADEFDVDQTLGDAAVDDFVGMVLPGGVANPDQLRMSAVAVSFVRRFAEAGKPIAAICHAPWTLIEADLVRDRTVTSWPSLKTDLRNAGASWVDEELCVDDGAGWRLVTSRKPDDLPAFCREAVRTFAGVAVG